MVVNKTAPDGTPRAEIHSGGLQAVAGVNWQSPGFAELYVHTEAEARQRGWGRSVAAACIERILGSGRIPLYLVEPGNEASVSLAQSLGFYSTGARQVFADAVYSGHPGTQ
jgi:predicted GNAT family acetyltransferase